LVRPGARVWRGSSRCRPQGHRVASRRDGSIARRPLAGHAQIGGCRGDRQFHCARTIRWSMTVRTVAKPRDE
jgi:hypothetical protein